MFDITQENVELAPKIPKSPGNCCVVSLVPFAIKETKPQIIPGYFQIPPAKQDDYQVLPVGESIYWMESPWKGMPPIRVTETSKAMARSIVNDYIEAQLATDTDCAPGLFWVEGHHSKDEIKNKFIAEIKDARERQNRWFVNLVRLADDDWEAYHQHKFISDIQRHAAKSLGMSREWISVTLDTMMTHCPLCKELVRPDAIVHNMCGYILRPEEYEKLKARILPKSAIEQLNSIGVR